MTLRLRLLQPLDIELIDNLLDVVLRLGRVDNELKVLFELLEELSGIRSEGDIDHLSGVVFLLGLGIDLTEHQFFVKVELLSGRSANMNQCVLQLENQDFLL